MRLLDRVTTVRTGRALGIALAAAGAVVACGGGLDGPAPDTRVFEGEQGWALAVLEEPAEAGVPPRIWILGEFEERTNLNIEFERIDESGSGGSFGLSWPRSFSGRWAETPGTPSMKAGEFELVLTSESNEVLVRGLLTVR